MNVPCVLLLLVVASIAAASCSEKATPDQRQSSNETLREAEVEREDKRRPEEDQVAEDCAAFVRSTKVVAAGAARPDCPACPAGGTEVFSLRGAKTDTASCSGDTCSVVVTIRAVFNPGAGDALSGGLTGWIPPEQRSAYLSGETPAGEQVFRVQITYKRRGAAWRAIEFDRAATE